MGGDELVGSVIVPNRDGEIRVGVLTPNVGDGYNVPHRGCDIEDPVVNPRSALKGVRNAGTEGGRRVCRGEGENVQRVTIGIFKVFGVISCENGPDFSKVAQKVGLVVEHGKVLVVLVFLGLAGSGSRVGIKLRIVCVHQIQR